VRTGMAEGAASVERKPRVGDLQRPAGAAREIVQELRPELREIYGRYGRPGALVEPAHRVDVGDPQRVADDGGPFGTVERDAAAPAAHEGERVHRAVGTHPADEAVVVLGGGIAVDVGDEVEVQVRVVLDGLGRLEALHREDLRDSRRGWLLLRLSLARRAREHQHEAGGDDALLHRMTLLSW